jgi:TRAP-type C4-dicarboxylate transport system substrate-binding protein
MAKPLTAAQARLVSCMGILAFAALAMAVVCGATAAQEKTQDKTPGKTIVMKLSTATLNDAQHEWMKRFAAAIEKNADGRIRGEVYPASQLGSIPRQIEGTQLGSIQAWVGAPEFLVGVDQRFELLSVPGLFQNDPHAIKTISDPEFAKAFLALGANKGLLGASLFITGPAVFDMRAPMRSLADLKGKKVRVLASPFQTEQLARLGGTGVPLSLGDVLPALQQGTLDGALGGLPVFGALQYQDTAKYITETGHAYVFSIAMLSKRWFDGLPADLQGIVMATADQVRAEVIPWSLDFLVQQRKTWAEKGGEVIALPVAERAELMAKMAPVGGDIVKTKPELKPLWDLLVATAKRSN